MKCAVIYFSQTGNTEIIAKSIYKGAKKTADQCDILPIKEANPQKLTQYDLIGIGCPIIGFIEPINVINFIKSIRFVGGKHAFVFDTHATRGEFFYHSIIPKLKKKGLTVVGMFDSYGNNWMGDGKNCPTSGHPDSIEIAEAEIFGQKIVEISKRIYNGEKELIPRIPAWAEKNVNKYIRDRQKREEDLGMPRQLAKRKMPPINWDREKCKYPKCGLCMENCPMYGIDLSTPKPLIAKPCIGCGFCMKICPTGALYREMPKGSALPMPSPEVSKMIFEEFYIQPVIKAEKEGRFRRYVEIKEMSQGGGFGSVPKKHPQWIIGKGPTS